MNVYDKRRTLVKSSQRPLSQSAEPLSDDLLNDIIGDVRSLSGHHAELQEVSTPVQDKRQSGSVWRDFSVH